MAVHERRWQPTALLGGVAHAVADRAGLAEQARALILPDVPGPVKIEIVAQLLRWVPLLLVFDDL